MTLSLGEMLPADEAPACDPGAVALLVLAARAGGDDAIEALHARFAPLVHGVILARVPSDAAEDLVQEVFLHALDRLHQLRAPEAFGAWIAAIARSFAVRFHRRHRPLAPLPEGLLAPARDGAAGERRREAERILEHVRGLPESYAETLALRLVEGLTGPQIARCLGMTHGAVRVNLHRGMALLRRRLEEKEDAR